MYSTAGSAYKMSPDSCLSKVATPVKVPNCFCTKCSALPKLVAYILCIRVPIVVTLIASETYMFNVLHVGTTTRSCRKGFVMDELPFEYVICLSASYFRLVLETESWLLHKLQEKHCAVIITGWLYTSHTLAATCHTACCQLHHACPFGYKNSRIAE
jgi:hypothetical protein